MSVLLFACLSAMKIQKVSKPENFTYKSYQKWSQKFRHHDQDHQGQEHQYQGDGKGNKHQNDPIVKCQYQELSRIV